MRLLLFCTNGYVQIGFWIINGTYVIAHFVWPEIAGGYESAHRVFLTLTGVATLAWFQQRRDQGEEYEAGYCQGRVDQHHAAAVKHRQSG